MIEMDVDLSQFNQAMNQNKTLVKKGRVKAVAALALFLEKEAKIVLVRNVKKWTGQLSRSIRTDRILGGGLTRIVGPHRIYSVWIEIGGRHPRWGTSTSFKGYKYMEKAVKKTNLRAKGITSNIMANLLGR